MAKAIVTIHAIAVNPAECLRVFTVCGGALVLIAAGRILPF